MTEGVLLKQIIILQWLIFLAGNKLFIVHVENGTSRSLFHDVLTVYDKVNKSVYIAKSRQRNHKTLNKYF